MKRNHRRKVNFISLEVTRKEKKRQIKTGIKTGYYYGQIIPLAFAGPGGS